MNTLFDELFSPQKTRWVKCSDDVYTVELELPGFSKEDVKITANSETLTIKAEKGERRKSEKITLNDLVSVQDIKSKMSNGLLKITMPKKQVRDSIAIKID